MTEETNQRPSVDDYPINQLNESNTFENSGLVLFAVEGVQMAFGFYGTEYQGKDHPYLCMLGAVTGGWKVIGKLAPLWNDDPLLGMDRGSAEELNTYMSLVVADTFTPLMQDFVTSNGVELGEEFWRSVHQQLSTWKIVNDRLVFDEV